MRIGQVFKNGLYNYALLLSYKAGTVSCACLDTGIVFDDNRMIRVESDQNITPDEFYKIVGVSHTEFTDPEGNPLYPDPVDPIIDSFIIALKDGLDKSVDEEKLKESLKLIIKNA